MEAPALHTLRLIVRHRDVIASLACVRLTGWPSVAWNWRRAVLSADAGLLVLSLTVEALQGKRCQDLLLTGRSRSVRAKMSGGRGRPWGIFFGFYKTRHISLSNGANCTVLRAVVLTQYRRVTDRQTDIRTDGIAVANTALAMRALRTL